VLPRVTRSGSLGLSPGCKTDDLRCLRLHGLIERIAPTHRDRLTTFGLMTAHVSPTRFGIAVPRTRLP
jgi:hypothetical protein